MSTSAPHLELRLPHRRSVAQWIEPSLSTRRWRGRGGRRFDPCRCVDRVYVALIRFIDRCLLREDSSPGWRGFAEARHPIS